MWWRSRSRCEFLTPREIVSTLDGGVDALFDPARYVVGFHSGLDPLDHLAGGLRPGTLTLLSGEAARGDGRRPVPAENSSNRKYSNQASPPRHQSTTRNEKIISQTAVNAAPLPRLTNLARLVARRFCLLKCYPNLALRPIPAAFTVKLFAGGSNADNNA
jgi:hypothetical protein